MKKIRITLDIEIQNLSDEDRAQLSAVSQMFDEYTMADMPGPEEVTAHDVADGIKCALDSREVEQEYIWAGSNLFAKFGLVTIVEAKEVKS